MSATTPGMRQIWTDAVVRCIDQQMENVAVDNGQMVQTSSVDNADVKSDFAGQNATASAGAISANQPSDHNAMLGSHNDAVAVKCSQTFSDKAVPGLTSIPRLQSSDICQLPASSSNNVLHTDSQSTDVCTVSLLLFLIS